MSGLNPFRHKKAASSPITPPARSSSTANVGDQDPGSTVSAAFDDDIPAHPSSRAKTVRIASPPVRSQISPIEPQSPLSTGTTTPFQSVSMRRDSPPPPVRDLESESSDDEASPDPFGNPEVSGNDEYDSQELEDSTQPSPRSARTQGSGTEQHEQQDPGGLKRSMPDADTMCTSRTPDGARSPEAQRKRATLDVDAFKRLLLTGDAGIELGPAPAHSPAQFQEERMAGGNVIDPKPWRQTNSESTPALQDYVRRGSSTMSSFEKERVNPEGQSKPSGKKKPPPPKVRHGKLIQSDTSDMSSLGISSPSPSSDNALLPLRPPSPSLSQQGGRVVSDPPIQRSDSTTRISALDRRAEVRSEAFLNPKPLPPIPPVRRSSQLKQCKPSLPISRSCSTRLPKTSSLSGSTAPRTPPPPPSRRKDRESSNSSPSTQSRFPITPDGTAPPDEEAEDASENTSLQRSETGSIHSVNRLSRLSGPSTVPPRPPPPRRSGGSQAYSSEDSRPARPMSMVETSSNQIKDKEVDEESPPAPRSNANNILADLSKLQKEVDEFRGKYEKKQPN
ncbi:hypothetical protein CIHG_02338 [Coccidioides immitis H538.4]|uniref:Uncharacterized protein n=1 Tax=Coccidioides immitis H538.4 TaxID=396776 RepID=A0A0J8RKS4_COCIT|nr:hypothetical protein CIHG_02338 [Coccidioides immitis H538.4]TPX26581.1 hypothetical protein DIZ76_012043 [Coccidioides immitis]